MTNIARHPVDRALAEECAEREKSSIEEGMKLSTARPILFRGMLTDAVAYAGYLAVLSPDAPELCRALRIATAAGVSLFSLATQTSGEVEVTLGEGTRWSAAATGPNSMAHFGSWLTSYQVAILTGDRAAVQRLCAVPMDVLRASSTVGDECSYLYVAALQAYEQRAPDAADRLLAALEATDPTTHEISDEEYVLDLLVPELQLLHRVMKGDISPFNEALQFALERHVGYWSKGDRVREPAGYLALGPAAFARIARAATMPIRVASDLIPAHLIEGSCEPKT